MRLSLFGRSLSIFISDSFSNEIWLSSSNILRTFGFSVVFENSFYVILNTTKGIFDALIIFGREIHESNNIKNEIQLLNSRDFIKRFYKPDLLSSNVTPMCWSMASPFLNSCSMFYVADAIRNLTRAGLKFMTTVECLRKALNNSSIWSSFLADWLKTVKSSLTKGPKLSLSFLNS